MLITIRKVQKIFSINTGNIVVISLHRLGDSVFTIQAIQHLQNYYKKKIFIFCYYESIPIYEIILKNVLYIPVRRTDFYFNNRIASLHARKKLKECTPSTIIDLTGVMTSASLIFNSKAEKIIGMNREIFKGIYDLFIGVSYNSHLSEMYFNVVGLLPVKIERNDFEIFQNTTKRIDRIIIHPFAGWKAKEWNFNKFIYLAQVLSNKYQVTFLVPVNNISLEIKDELKGYNFDYVETNSMEELISVISKCSMLIGNDSGPIHIASLLGKATFTIYGPSNPKFSLPFGPTHKYIQKRIKCSPIETENLCFMDGGRSGCPSFECMNGLSVEEVLNSVNLFIHDLQNNSITK